MWALTLTVSWMAWKRDNGGRGAVQTTLGHIPELLAQMLAAILDTEM